MLGWVLNARTVVFKRKEHRDTHKEDSHVTTQAENRVTQLSTRNGRSHQKLGRGEEELFSRDFRGSPHGSADSLTSGFRPPEL